MGSRELFPNRINHVIIGSRRPVMSFHKRPVFWPDFYKNSVLLACRDFSNRHYVDLLKIIFPVFPAVTWISHGAPSGLHSTAGCTRDESHPDPTILLLEPPPSSTPL